MNDEKMYEWIIGNTMKAIDEYRNEKKIIQGINKSFMTLWSVLIIIVISRPLDNDRYMVPDVDAVYGLLRQQKVRQHTNYYTY